MLVNDKVNILMVDDQPQRLLSYQSVLHELGQNLITARSGEEALHQMMKHEFAVVLLDVSMPGMDGFETAAMIHDHPRFERTPIIFVTGVHDSDMDRLRGYKLGAVDYVSIPVVPEILRSKVGVLVELHCQRLKLQELNKHLSEANTNLLAEKHRELEALNVTLRDANNELESTNQALKNENAERLRAENALKEADRQKDEFIAILAHELRNPLAPIRSALEIMAQMKLPDSRLQWSRDVVQRQVSHLTRLVDDLLDISRITRGTINLSKEPISIGTILGRSLEIANPIVKQRGHELTIECDDDSALIEGDVTRLVQVMGNLLSNAAKYTPPGGRIEVSAHNRGADVEFVVRDNGQGIPAESIPKLFTLFSRLPEPQSQQHDGLGIGLALARQLVQLHGGDIAVYSGGVGHGSEFTVKLPLISAKSTTSKAQRLGEPKVHGAPVRFKILVADDNNDALETLSLLLEMAGHEVTKASNGQDALNIALDWQPDIALLDIGMPQLNGYDVAKRIRAATIGRSVTLVAISGWGQSDDKRRSSEAGFDLHLVKPVDFNAVESILASCAAQRNQSEIPASEGLRA